MARSSARQRRLSKARNHPLPAAPPVTKQAPRADRRRFVQVLALVLLTPALVAAAARGSDDFSLLDGTLLTVAIALFQCAVLAIAFVRAQTDGAVAARPARLAALAIAVMAGLGLIITAAMPVAGWLTGVAMLACFVADAVTGRRGRLGWAPLVFGIACAVCWVFASMGEWDALLWWSFLLAAFASIALNSAGVRERQRAQNSTVLTRRMLGGALAAVGLFCSTAALVLAWRAPGAAVLIAIEGAFALLFIQRAARRFGQQGVLGSAAAACVLGAAVFVAAI